MTNHKENMAALLKFIACYLFFFLNGNLWIENWGWILGVEQVTWKFLKAVEFTIFTIVNCIVHCH
jgi:hypothetical protein